MALYSDEELVKEIKQGNEEAFEAFYNKVYHEIYFFCKDILGKDAKVDEIIADCFLKLWKLRHNYESIQNMKAFLFIRAKNNCMDALKEKTIEINKSEMPLLHWFKFNFN